MPSDHCGYVQGALVQQGDVFLRTCDCGSDAPRRSQAWMRSGERLRNAMNVASKEASRGGERVGVSITLSPNKALP